MKVWTFSAGGIDGSSRLMTGRGPFVGGYAVSLTCILVERGDGLVLVDSGWGSPTVRDPRAFPGTLFELTAGRARVSMTDTALGRVQALGYRAEDVRDIVLTHLDIDHVGGLVDFPHARVHVADPEHAARFHRKQPFRSRVHYSLPAFAHGPNFCPVAWTDHSELGFARSADVFGDGTVMLLDAGGHTVGHAAVLVRTGAQLLVHAGDSFVHRAELEGDEKLPLGVRLYRRVLHENKADARATLNRMRDLHRNRSDVTIVNAHDAGLLSQLPTFPALFSAASPL